MRTKKTLDTVKLPRRPRLPKVEAPHILSRGPKHLQAALWSDERLDGPGEVPEGLVATKPEWYCLWALRKLGRREEVDFSFQSSMLGGRLELGGAVVDFLFYNPPGLGINIQGIYWHYGFGGERKAHDMMVRRSLEAQGIHMVYIDEDAILRNPLHYTQEALAGRDHSRMGSA